MRKTSWLFVVALGLTASVHLVDYLTVRVLCGSVVDKFDGSVRCPSKVVSVDIPGHGVWNQRVSGQKFIEIKRGDVYCFKIDSHKIDPNIHKIRNSLAFMSVIILTFAVFLATKELL